jgi:transcriptional regulator
MHLKESPMPTDLLAAARVFQLPGPDQPTATATATATAAASPGPVPGLPADLPAELDGLTSPDEPGSGGTLLAVVPIPGTGSSLAIVGYTVPSCVTRERGQAPSRGDGSGLVVDHARRCVWLSGREVQLTYQEFELLAFLGANPAQVFSRADLLERVWGQRENSRHRTRTVDVHVSRLRRKLGPVFGQCLTTEHRVGYRFDPTMDVSG